MIAVGIQIAHAQKKGISNTAKSAYYRSATVLTCTIIEGMVYHLVKKNTDQVGNIIGNRKDFKKLHQLPEKVFQRKDVVICQEIDKKVHINDNGATFEKLNIFLRDKGLITVKEFKKLDYIRVERNKLHLQGLDIADIGYTKTKVNKVSESLNFLVKKL